MSAPPSASASGINTAYDHLFKIVLIGDAGVGKSSILLRFTDDRFEEGHLSTIGVDLRVKFVDIEKPAKKRIKVTVWDTAGQEYVCFNKTAKRTNSKLCRRFRTLTASYFHKVQGLILVYDVTRRETFDNLAMWNNEVDINTDGAPVVRILVGNKVDDHQARQVSKKEGEQWAQEHNMMFIESSAKTRTGINQVFMECIMQILDNQALMKQTLIGGNAGVTLSQPANGESGGGGAGDGGGNGGCC